MTKAEVKDEFRQQEGDPMIKSRLRQIRNRDTGSILQEGEHLHVEHGYTGFMFYDDELNVSKSFVDLMNGAGAALRSR